MLRIAVVATLVLAACVARGAELLPEVVEVGSGDLSLDFDAWLEAEQGGGTYVLTQGAPCVECEPTWGYAPQQWTWHILPVGLLYRSYLAGPLEPRFAAILFDERDQDTLWDVTLGARAGVLRYGTPGDYGAQGWQVDVEGASFPRLDFEQEQELLTTDFRFGIPITYRDGPAAIKLAYYHLSSHLGDELIERDPSLVRVNYSRDAFVFGLSYDVVSDLRLYGEVGVAFFTAGGAEPWETQFGIEWAPLCPTGDHGAPFLALNGQLWEDVSFSGTFTAQAGWSWSGDSARRLFRLGVHYQNGTSNQRQFFLTHEHQFGMGIWYDF